MKFWLPLMILLTTLSPNLEADTIDPGDALTKQPYSLALQLWNVDFSHYTWTGDVTVEDYDPASDIITGSLDWKANGSIFASREFRGRLTEDGAYTSVKIFPNWGTVWRGQFSEDFLSASGTMRGLGTSNMVGSWTLTAVELPAALGLLICAVATVPLFARRKAS